MFRVRRYSTNVLQSADEGSYPSRLGIGYRRVIFGFDAQTYHKSIMMSLGNDYYRVRPFTFIS